MELSGTQTAILDAALALVQTQGGYSTFSYKDLALKVGIRAPTIHYHFPAKADMGEALMARYRRHFAQSLDDIDRGTTGPADRLRAYFQIFLKTAKDPRRRCLFGVLVSEFPTLPKALQSEVLAFGKLNEEWLAGVLREGRKANELVLTASAASVAATLFASLEGAMVTAAATQDASRLKAATKFFLAAVTP